MLHLLFFVGNTLRIMLLVKNQTIVKVGQLYSNSNKHKYSQIYVYALV